MSTEDDDTQVSLAADRLLGQAQSAIDAKDSVAMAAAASAIRAFDNANSAALARLGYADFGPTLDALSNGQANLGDSSLNPLGTTNNSSIISQVGDQVDRLAKKGADIIGQSADTVKTILYILAVAIGLALVAAVFIYAGGNS